MKYLEHFQNFKHPNLDILKLNTSNKNKAREYQEFGLKIKGMSNIDIRLARLVRILSLRILIYL